MISNEITKDLQVLGWEELIEKYSEIREHYEFFKGLSKKELDIIRKSWSFRGLSSLKKDELSVELLKRILFDVGEYSEDLLGYEVIEGDTSSPYLLNKGLVFDSGNDFILNYVKGFVVEDDKKDIVEISRGLIQYYGFIEIKELKKALENYNVSVTLKKLEKTLKEHSILDNTIEIAKKHYKLTDCIIDKDTIRRLSKDKEYYYPELVEVKKHAKEKTFNIVNRQMFDKIFDSIDELKDNKEEVLAKSFVALNNGGKINEISAEIIEEYKLDNLKYSSVIQESFKDIFASSSLWELKGNTPNSIYELLMQMSESADEEEKESKPEVAPHVEEAPSMPVRRKKIGRNEPCPCGSGKKYKKCCLNK
jgi:uncharacterized protein YecA (UPF0149 family)